MEKNEQKRTEIAKERVLKALEKSLGIVTTALKMAELSRTSYYQWLKEDDEFAAQVKEIENIEKDFIRSKYYECIKDKVPSVIVHAAKTQLGLSEKQQIDITTQGDKINKIEIEFVSIKDKDE
tara:strand:+ start:2358 stop:2726 length:369 start_codon:yes stop_codon:yes gene_type:complete